MIEHFRGDYSFLSNFFPEKITVSGKEYPTVEHYFQAMKTKDPLEREKIRTAETPGKAKRLGRTVKLRPDWHEIKLKVMEQALRKKFADPELKALLKETGSQELIEGNEWGDKFWGCVQEEEVWVGENNLGKLLMKIRDEN